jgi:hypothetical protein
MTRSNETTPVLIDMLLEKHRKEPPTMGKQLVNFITCDCESSAPFLAHLAKDHVSFCHHLGVRRTS